MAKKKEKNELGWRGLFRTVRDLKLPWFWIGLSLLINLTETTLLLKLPVTTSELLGGNVTGGALGEAIAFYALTGLVGVLSVSAMAHAQSFAVRRTRDRVWEKMLRLRMDWFDRNDPSELMSAITSDSAGALTLVNILLNLPSAVYYVIGAVLTVGSYHWLLAASCFALLPLKYVYALLMGRAFQKSNMRLYDRIGVLTGFLADRIRHLPLIKTYTSEEAETKNGEKAANELLKANMRIVHQNNVVVSVTSILDILQKFVVIVVAVVLLRKKWIDLAMWLAFFLFSQNLFSNMDTVFDYWTKIKGLQGSFQRVTEIMCAEEETTEGEAFPENGDVSFENVMFTYPGADTPALKNVSFNVPKGTSCAIVGLCGSGKTTAISLLERLYQPDSGRVSVGGKEISGLSLGEYRKNIAYVQQNAPVFSGTLRENLTYGIDRECPDQELLTAAEQTGFAEYIAQCPNGLDTLVAPDGASMSGGQSQRLVLTRELLRDGNILLLDEPTSALDVQISEKIQATIENVFADKTRILVTHDLTFARRCDQIVVLSGGVLMGQGTHEELLETCEAYRAMTEKEAIA